MNTFRKYSGRNTSLVVAAILIILMMGNLRALPMVGAFSGATGYEAVFYRNSCDASTSSPTGDLGSPITAEFGPDTNGNTTSATMTINEVGSQATMAGTYGDNNGSGDFRLYEQAAGQEYGYGSPETDQWPGVEVNADFRGYEIYEVNMIAWEPGYGFDADTVKVNDTGIAASYSGNLSSTTNEFRITIKQTSSSIIAYWYVISSSGTVLDSWDYYMDWSAYASYNPPPYKHFLAVDELAGLESKGYAQLNSGTDFQIESIIPQPSNTDFTQYVNKSYTSPNAHFTSPCSMDWFSDDEGGGSSATFGTHEYAWNGNEAYQYVPVTDGSSGGSYTITINSQNQYGSSITGYYCVLRDSGGSSLGTGFTPCTFSGKPAGNYQVEADSYGSCTFDHWSGGGITGDTGDPQPITISGSTTVTAIYDC